MVLPNGQITYVHEGFLTALEHVLPHVKRWVDGYIFGLFNAVPKDWASQTSGLPISPFGEKAAGQFDMALRLGPDGNVSGADGVHP